MEVRRFRSKGADEVAEIWSEFAPTSKLNRMDEEQGKLEWFSASSPGFSLIRYELTASVESSIAPEDQLFTCSVQSTSGGSESGRRPLPHGRPWASHGAPVRSKWSESAIVHAMVFDLEHAEDLARQMSGDDALSLRLKRPEAIGPQEASHWERTFNYLSGAVLAGDVTLDPDTLVGRGLQRHALWTILSTFSTTFSDAWEANPQRTAAPLTVRRALAYIDAHAHEPISIDDIAAAAHISTRGLQYAFRRALDYTPSEYLRRARLAGARRDLAEARVGETVTTIARRWGFSNTSRFTASYRSEFGTHPVTEFKANR
ncbi:AraC family transcriptional regulator [Leucobacter sp. USHLN153]|uniref:AraC family transcriptional regulator n=1 Tax=Leucobacter sp. USHLN153 TaxID=3081268 RepID=UPI00301A2BF4